MGGQALAVTGMESTVRELNRIFKAANAHLFGGRLPNPQIVVVPAGRMAAYGWCTTSQVWVADGARRYEIALTAEHLGRGGLAAAGTLLHEMVHLDNLRAGVTDVSGNQYHNKHFKTAAERIGLVVAQTERHGFSRTSLGPALEAWVRGLRVKESAFKLQRRRRPPAETKMQRWACLCTNVRCAVELVAKCVACGQWFVQGRKAKRTRGDGDT